MIEQDAKASLFIPSVSWTAVKHSIPIYEILVPVMNTESLRDVMAVI